MPCLEHIHGSTSRIDDLVASLLALLKSACQVGEEVTVYAFSGHPESATVEQLSDGAPPTQRVQLLSSLATARTALAPALSRTPRRACWFRSPA